MHYKDFACLMQSSKQASVQRHRVDPVHPNGPPSECIFFVLVVYCDFSQCFLCWFPVILPPTKHFLGHCSSFRRANADHIRDGLDEYLSVSELSGISGIDNGIHHDIHLRAIGDYFYPDFLDELVLSKLRPFPSLSKGTLHTCSSHFGHRQSAYAFVI